MKKLIILILTLFVSINCFAQPNIGKAKETVQEFITAVQSGNGIKQAELYSENVRYFKKNVSHEWLKNHLKNAGKVKIDIIGDITIKAENNHFFCVFKFKFSKGTFYKLLKLDEDFKIYCNRDFLLTDKPESERIKDILDK